VLRFLVEDDAKEGDCVSAAPAGLSTPGGVPSEHSMRQNVLHDIRSGSKKKSPSKVSSPARATTAKTISTATAATKNPPTTSADADSTHTAAERLAKDANANAHANTHAPTTNSKHAEQLEDEFFIRGVASAGLDSRTTRVLEARIFDLIKEVLDVDNMNVLRRNFVALLHQSVRLFFSTTLKTWASAQAKVSIVNILIVLYC
jgi:hypothetical protein